MSTTPSKNCVICNKSFVKPVSDSKKTWAGRHYCSSRCANSRVKNRGIEPIPNIKHGLTGYNNYRCRCDICRDSVRFHKRQQRAGIKTEHWGLKEELNPAWKGDAVGYKCLHDWVKRYKPKTGICSHCKVNYGTRRGHATQWANVNHSYRRNLDDYIELCPACHKKYDLENNLGKRAIMA